MDTVLSIVEKYLEDNDYDGLYDPKSDCRCLLEEHDLMACGNDPALCIPGFKVMCNDKYCGCEDWHIKPEID